MPEHISEDAYHDQVVTLVRLLVVATSLSPYAIRKDIATIALKLESFINQFLNFSKR